MKNTLIALGACAVALAGSASANVLVNGGFETGDFTGWTEVTASGANGCDTDWYVSTTDTECQFTNTQLNSAIEGEFAAYNSFDGGGPKDFTIEQTFTLGSSLASAMLDFQYTVGWDFSLGGNATEARIFTLSFVDAMDNLIGDAFTLTIDPANGETGFIDWTAVSVDVSALLSAFVGQDITLVANVNVPQDFTGPGSFGLDALALNVNEVPLPAAFWLGLLGFGGLMRLSKARRS